MQKYYYFTGSIEWKAALFHAMPISLFMLSLFYYWFALADRYVIFLYGHLGATPFDARTSSRYWMARLVASGAVLGLYTLTHWFLGRLSGVRDRTYSPPAWWQVWFLCVAPLAIGIPVITMTFNQPTLPLSNAITCVVATLIGLGLALTPGSLAAQHPLELGWLIVSGIGLMPSFLLLRAIELPTRGFASPTTAYGIAIGSTLAGAVWLAITAWLQTWRHQVYLGARQLFIAGLCLSYLLLPLIHYWLLTPPGFRYISTSANFLALNPSTQLISFLVAAMLAIGIPHWQRRWQ